MIKYIPIILFIIFSFFLPITQQAIANFDKKVDIIFNKLEEKYKDETVWVKNQQYRKIILLLNNYKTTSKNIKLNDLISLINTKLNKTINDYEDKVDNWDCNETYNFATIGNWNGKCVCVDWYDWTQADDWTSWCADYQLSSCIQELGFLSIYNSDDNTCGCRKGYHIWEWFWGQSCIENSKHYKITTEWVFAPKLYFWWYLCTDDCSWHIAWYDWAVKKNIQHSYDCWWNSQSFIEWCYVFTNE